MKFKPLVDKYFYTPIILVLILFIAPIMVGIVCKQIDQIIITSLLFIVIGVLLISPLFGYVKIEDDHIFIKYGLFFKRKIFYTNITEITKERKFYATSLISHKTALDHVFIKYNKYDDTCISIKNMDVFIALVEEKRLYAK